ncbi:aryl-sulfate sulfotransferase [bacterium]|nr:aryl-sulfate sulfotransferase [bacterium]
MVKRFIGVFILLSFWVSLVAGISLGKPMINSSQLSEPSSESQKRSPMVVGEPTILANGVSVPSDFPYIEVMVNENPAPGKIFLNNWSDSSPYNVMFNSDGTPYWYNKTIARQRDFKVQRNGLLTARYIPSINGIPGGAFIAYDSTYAVVDTFLAAPDNQGRFYEVDEHELVVLEDGGYLLVALDYRQVDMSEFFEDGKTNAGVAFSHLQEFDSEGNLILHFDTQENLNIGEFTQIEEHVKYGGRFPHMNAIDVDEDNNLIFSCRHLSAVYKIQRQTGEIIWKLGGINGNFTFVNDPFNGFSGQHAVSVLGNNRYLLFDNGNNHNPKTSRAVEYELDLDAMTATLVWEYRQDPDAQFSHYMGNAQRLPNGNTLINWAEGGRPKATEVTPDGTKVYEMNFINHYDCYRTYKFDWNVPAVRPYLIIESRPAGPTLLFNQFGDPDVDYYNIYHGTDPHPTAILDSSRLTMKSFENLENIQYHYFRVTSVSKTGVESDFSNEEATMIKRIGPGDEQILNGDFSGGDDFWIFGMYGYSTNAEGEVNDGVYHLHVGSISGNNGGAYVFQYPVELLEDQTYRFEFDAWADQKLNILPMVANNTASRDYSRIGNVPMGTSSKHYAYEFTKRSSSTSEAIAGFLMGENTGTLYVDNVSLKQVMTSVDETKAVKPERYQLEKNYPNPFNGKTTLKFSVPYSSDVTFVLYDILGRQVREIKKGSYSPGSHLLVFHDESLSSGVYFCKMKAGPKEEPQTFERVIKMILMK